MAKAYINVRCLYDGKATTFPENNKLSQIRKEANDTADGLLVIKKYFQLPFNFRSYWTASGNPNKLLAFIATCLVPFG